ncbi:helix-turn-helix transcriptional regulator [Nocardia seriolae]|nr:helix-turn-helix transcriptional regulator [Nocardia seriolae]
MRELLLGERRFGDIRRGIPRISKTMLSTRLKELERAGVIARDGDGYLLTEAGLALTPLLKELGGVGRTLGSARLAARASGSGRAAVGSAPAHRARKSARRTDSRRVPVPRARAAALLPAGQATRCHGLRRGRRASGGAAHRSGSRCADPVLAR